MKGTLPSVSAPRPIALIAATSRPLRDSKPVANLDQPGIGRDIGGSGAKAQRKLRLVLIGRDRERSNDGCRRRARNPHPAMDQQRRRPVPLPGKVDDLQHMLFARRHQCSISGKGNIVHAQKQMTAGRNHRRAMKALLLRHQADHFAGAVTHGHLGDARQGRDDDYRHLTTPPAKPTVPPRWRRTVRQTAFAPPWPEADRSGSSRG